LTTKQVAAVEHAEKRRVLAGRLDVAVAEIGFAAGEERDVGPHALAVLGEKADQAAVMVEMAMAQDEPVEFRRIDLEQIDVAGQHLRRETEIEEVAACLAALERFQME
jgi:hypothetical protein